MKSTGRNINKTSSGDDFSSLLPTEPLKELVVEETEVLSQYDLAFKSKYGVTIAEAPIAIQRIHTRLEEYEELMNDKAVVFDVATGAENQLKLFNVLMRALSCKDNESFMAIDLVLTHFYIRRDDVYTGRLVYRFTKGIKRSQSEVESYLRILEIFLILTNPTNRVKEAGSARVRNAVATIDPAFKEAAFNLVTYLSQYKV